MRNNRIIKTLVAAVFLLALFTISVLAQEGSFTESFDDPSLPGWNRSSEVTVEDGILHLDPGNHIAKGGNWQDMELSTRLQRSGGGEIVIFYQTSAAGSYILVIGPDFIISQRESGGVVSELAAKSPLAIPLEDWFEVKISVSGGNHQIMIDGVNVLESEDADPLPPGGMGFETLGGAYLEVDEITIIVAGNGESASVDETPEPTAIHTVMPNFDPTSQSWIRLGGPLGGLGYDIRMHPDDPDIMYVTDANAGVHKSDDGGQTWISVNEGIDLRTGITGDLIPVFCLTIDPNNNDTIWIGLTGVGGIYRSGDAGRTWQKRTQGIIEENGLTIRGITVEPGNSNIVYAAGEVSSFVWAGESRSGRGFDMTMGVVYKSTDGGQNWDAIWRGDNLARYIWIDPTNTQIIYVSTGIFDREAANTDVEANDPGGVGIIKSTDGGRSWEVIDADNGLTGLYVGTLFMHPEDPRTLLAGTGHDYWSGPHDQGGVELTAAGVFISNDGGNSWRRTLEGEPIYSVEYCIGNPDIAYAAGPYSVYRSENGGDSWKRVSGGQDSRGYWGPPGVVAGFPIDIQCDPRDHDRLFVNNYGGGNFLSEDGGKTWVDASKGYSGAIVFGGLAMSPSDPTRIYAGARSGLFSSNDSGETWAGLAYEPARHAEITALGVSPVDADIIISSPWDISRLVRSETGGIDWQPMKRFGEQSASRAADLVFSVTDPNIAYLALSNPDCKYLGFDACKKRGGGIYKSNDGGLTWSNANDDNTKAINAMSIAVDPVDADIVYVAAIGKGAFKSSDGGASWEKLSLNCDVWSLAVHPTDSSVIYAGCQGGLHISKDSGETWNRPTAGLPPQALYIDIVIDPSSPNSIWAADYFSGIYFSDDDGSNWVSHNEGLTVRAVTDLVISQDGRTLFAATHGGGVYRLDLEDQPPESTASSVAGTQPVTEAASVDEVSSESEPTELDRGVVIGIVLAVIVIGAMTIIISRRRRRQV
ncbi:MAG: DUF1080 domain-containing protein [Anaerolineae bacterium]|nr:DUF1080 domain-containing protein [Anaerolineae bacterium]